MVTSSEEWKFWGVLLLGAIPTSALWSVFTADELKDFLGTLVFAGIFLLPAGIICLFQSVSIQAQEAREAASYLALEKERNRSKKSSGHSLGSLVLVFLVAMLFGARCARASR